MWCMCIYIFKYINMYICIHMCAYTKPHRYKYEYIYIYRQKNKSTFPLIIIYAPLQLTGQEIRHSVSLTVP